MLCSPMVAHGEAGSIVCQEHYVQAVCNPCLLVRPRVHKLYMKWRLVWLQDPPYDAGSFAKIVTRDASKEGGSAPACASNVRQVRHL